MLVSNVQANNLEATAYEYDEENVEKIIVKGQKIDRTLQETPVSVDVVTGKEIVDYNLNDLTDIFAQTANVTSTFGGSGFTIRGIQNTNVTGFGVADLATVFVDGAPLPREATFTGPLNLWDLKQVEILRGPQSTLQGRNTLAGAIMVKTADPTYYWSGNARFQYFDENNEQRLGVAVGGPIIEDELAFRIAAEVTSEEGLLFNPTRNEFVSEQDSTLVRAKLLYEPEAIDGLSVLLSHTYDERDYGDDNSNFELENPYGNRQVLSDALMSDESEINLTVLTIDYDINSEWAVTSVTTYDETTRIRQRDGDYSALPLLTNRLEGSPESTTQEVRFTYDGEKLSGVFGGFYSNFDATEQGAFNRVNIFPADLGLPVLLVAPPDFGGFGLPQSVADQVLAQYAEGVMLDVIARSPIDIETIAFFSDFTYRINENWRLFAGLRYDNEKQDQGTSQETVLLTELPDPTLFGPLGPIFAGINGFLQAEIDNANDDGQTANTDFSEFLPKLGASYDVNENLNFSFIAQRGFRSGGTGVNIAAAAPFTFGPEFTWNYELSMRSQWLDGDLTVNANLFYIDWEDMQVQVFLSDNVFDSETQNVSSSSVKGAELELRYTVSDNLSTFASIGYAKTAIDEFIANVIRDDAPASVDDLSGNEFGNAPRYTFAIGGVYLNDSGFYASFDMNFTDESFERINQDQFNDFETIPSRTIANAKVGYRQDNYGIYLIATNIFEDEFFYNDFVAASGVKHGRYGEPRIIGASVELSF